MSFDEARARAADETQKSRSCEYSLPRAPGSRRIAGASPSSSSSSTRHTPNLRGEPGQRTCTDRMYPQHHGRVRRWTSPPLPRVDARASIHGWRVSARRPSRHRSALSIETDLRNLMLEFKRALRIPVALELSPYVTALSNVARGRSTMRRWTGWSCSTGSTSRTSTSTH